MNIVIRHATPEDLPQYTNLIQKTYEATYVNDAIGLTKECFSPAVFGTPEAQGYLLKKLIPEEGKVTWLALIGEDIVGAMTREQITDMQYRLEGFYVLPEYQHQGIGGELYARALAGLEDKQVILKIYAHNENAINLYHRWGYEIDSEKGFTYRRWAGWPEGVQAKCVYMKRGVEKV